MTAGALDGLRVVDLTRYIPGPYCTMLLADLGADVVKLEEPPVGDPTRLLPAGAGEESAAHAALNRNKRSLLVDLRSEKGAQVARRLAAGADVLVEGFRPGVLARRGLGAEALCAENPRLVYCSLTGFGSDGPLAGRAGHDVTYLARAGFLAGTHDQEGQPVLPATPIADMSGALLGFGAILAALQARERTGRGQVVEASLFAGALSFMSVPIARTLAGGQGMRELSGAYPGYRTYRCRDGRYLAVGALEPKFWEALCRALGLTEHLGRQWAEGERGRDTIAAFARAFSARDRDDWVDALAGTDACVEPVLDEAEAAAQEQAASLLGDQPAGDRSLRTVGCPLRLRGTPASRRRPAPGLGEHTDEVLGELGYGGDDVAALRREGVVA
jgi:alpha-methylacyl-CoA racemase